MKKTLHVLAAYAVLALVLALSLAPVWIAVHFVRKFW
jgi:hypothetical protein